MTEARDAMNAGTVTPHRLDHLLQGCSRTFALTIPLLHEPTRCEVTVAYLLFRVADIFEDSTLWPGPRKQAELEGLARFLEDPSPGAAEVLAAAWEADPPVAVPGHRELLVEFPAVMLAARTVSPRAWRLVSTYSARTCRAMSSFVARERNGILRLADLDDLRAYCYAVAGIVGEMLTELFLLGSESLGPVASRMREDAASFGEALQLVNILKDRSTDASEGRFYLPENLDPAEVFALARRDLATAARYCARLERAGSDKGIVSFTALPLLLARATLDRVDRQGPGAKVSRDDVAALLKLLHEAVGRNAVAALLERAEGEGPETEGRETPSPSQ